MDFIGEFLYYGAIDVEDLVVGSIQALDDSVYDFNEDEVEEFYYKQSHQKLQSSFVTIAK